MYRTTYECTYDTYLNGPVVGVKQQLCERRQLRCAVPSVATVHEYGHGSILERLCYEPARTEQATQIMQPFAGVESFEPPVKWKKNITSQFAYEPQWSPK